MAPQSELDRSAPDIDLRAYRSVRHSIALSELNHVSCLRVVGRDAFDLLDRACPSDIYIREGQMLHTLLLDDSGCPFVDLYVCCEEEDDFILLADGASAAEIGTCWE